MFKLTDTPSALPGSCYFCSSASRGSYVDTTCDIEFHGAVYVCDICVTEMARLLGFIPPVEAEALKYENQALFDLIKDQNKRLENCGEIIRGFTDLTDALAVDVDSLGSSHSVGHVAEQEPLPGTPDVGTGEGEASESGDDEGVAELSDDAESFLFNLT